MAKAAVPNLIRLAGEPAVRAYREFLVEVPRNAKTLQVYRSRIGGFCRWAEARAVPLDLVEPRDVWTYLELRSPGSAVGTEWVLRRLFDRLTAAGALAPASAARREARFVWELQSLRRELMAGLDERYAGDPTFDLIKSLDRALASMAPTADEPSAGTQEAPNAQ